MRIFLVEGLNQVSNTMGSTITNPFLQWRFVLWVKNYIGLLKVVMSYTLFVLVSWLFTGFLDQIVPTFKAPLFPPLKMLHHNGWSCVIGINSTKEGKIDRLTLILPQSRKGSSIPRLLKIGPWYTQAKEEGGWIVNFAVVSRNCVCTQFGWSKLIHAHEWGVVIRHKLKIFIHDSHGGRHSMDVLHR
jgi:hypothetical protein